MGNDDTVIGWVRGLQDRNHEAAQRLWERYFAELVRLAGAKLPRQVRRSFDEEDVALSAFKSFCAAAEQGRFPQLADRSDLWRLLVTITARKADHYKRHQMRRKRGGGKVLGESDLDGEDMSFDTLIGHCPSPAFALEVAEEWRRLFDQLGEELRQVAQLKLEGYTVEDIAAKLGLSRRAVERRLHDIRRVTSEGFGKDEG
jgi:DNA-directed RNA polymerase specialized sigma24 family protein